MSHRPPCFLAATKRHQSLENVRSRMGFISDDTFLLRSSIKAVVVDQFQVSTRGIAQANSNGVRPTEQSIVEFGNIHNPLSVSTYYSASRCNPNPHPNHPLRSFWNLKHPFSKSKRRGKTIRHTRLWCLFRLQPYVTCHKGGP